LNKSAISIIIPLHNEAESLNELFNRIKSTCEKLSEDYQVIFVNDGSTDESEQILNELYQANDKIVVIHLFKCMGKAVALERGFDFVKGGYVIIMDGDLQYDPEDIPQLIDKMKEGYDVVSGMRVNRNDSKENIVTSRLFNVLMRFVTGLAFKDYFTGLKCFNMNVVKYLALYGDLYRFATVFAYRDGFKVTEIPINHHKRVHGQSNYTVFTRLKKGIMDLGTIFFTMIFSRKRMYYLGLVGLLLIALGSALFYFMFLFSFNGKSFDDILMVNLGLMCLFLGIQIRILNVLTNDFFFRHQEERSTRKNNIKEVLQRWNSMEKIYDSC